MQFNQILISYQCIYYFYYCHCFHSLSILKVLTICKYYYGIPFICSFQSFNTSEIYYFKITDMFSLLYWLGNFWREKSISSIEENLGYLAFVKSIYGIVAVCYHILIITSLLNYVSNSELNFCPISSPFP